MSVETRSTSALFKRAEQLKRWHESDTAKEPDQPKAKKHQSNKSRNRNVRFTDGCVFLASCSAADKDEVARLVDKGADIDTANVDGLTALHQACIDDNLDMVEFLVSRGADVNRGDNEGWTPLHATASCGFLSIARYLLENGADVASVNNDGELAIDISESDEMEELLQREIDSRGIDCEDSRNREERLMLDDAKSWINDKSFADSPHPKTGASAMHVAAAKGYTRVISLLLKAGAPVNCQDNDGWTPMHAAAHWGQRDACQLLCENYANMEIRNYVGQTCFDVADADVIRLLEDLRRKQASLQKDRPEIRNLINRPPVTAPTSSTSQPSSLGATGKRRSSITRLSVDDKAQRSKEVSSQERDLLLTKAKPPETIQENKNVEEAKQSESDSSSCSESESDPSESELLNSRNKLAGGLVGLVTTKRNWTNTVEVPKIVTTPTEEKQQVKFTEKKTEKASPDTEEVHPWRRPASLRTRPPPQSSSQSSSSPSASPSTKAKQLAPKNELEEIQLRRVHSFESDDKKRRDDINNRPKAEGTKNQQLPNQVGRSFVPPVRDEESETQRKAHAKRVRETRRSTQGVTLEDLKSAEQLVKKKQQQENQQRTSELQQLAANATVGSVNTGTTTLTNTTTTTTKTTEQENKQERRPSWRLKVDNNDKNRFRLEDVCEVSPADTMAALRSKAQSAKAANPIPTISLPDDRESVSLSGSSSPKPTQQAIQRRKKPKRRSAGVVQLDMDEVDDGDSDEDEDDPQDKTFPSDTLRGSVPSATSTSLSVRGASAAATNKNNNHNGDVDYKKLWEESHKENVRLRDEMSRLKDDLGTTKRKLDTALHTTSSSSNSGLSESEKKEKKALEKKLSEMEEELKQLEHLKNDNQRLRDENGALIRVISELSK